MEVSSNISRRSALATLAAGAMAAMLPGAVGAAPEGRRLRSVCAPPPPPRGSGFETAPIKSEFLENSVRVLSGPGGNITVILADDGKIVIDSGVPARGKDVLAAAAALDGKPVATLIDTHFHFDHAGGNAVFASAGAKIVSHANTRARLSTRQFIDFMGMNFDAMPKIAWPTVTFDDALTLYAGDQTLHLAHVAPAHTDTDIFIHLPDAEVLVCGDLFFNGFYPFIDYSAGGSCAGMIAAGKQLLSVAGDKTRIVPGHGAIGVRADLEKFIAMLQEADGRVAAAIAKGVSEQDAVAQNLLHDLDPQWGQRMFTGNKFVSLLYRARAYAAGKH